MPQKGRSLHIGLNNVNTQAYQQQGFNVPVLSGCINDATAMQLLAAKQGFITQSLIDDQATSSEVIRLLGSYALEMSPGDIFFLTFSGHGGQVDDVNGDEDDGKDETWVLWDRMFIDDELYQLFSQFEAGVRIVMLSDSCHSGTVARMIVYSAISEQYRQVKLIAEGSVLKDVSPGLRNVAVTKGDFHNSREVQAIARAAATSSPRFRGLTAEMSDAIYRKNKRSYDTFQFLAGRSKDANFAPSLILISGCQDWQLSQDGDQNGLFTQNLLNVWNNGTFSGDYHALWQEISAHMPPSQTPNLYQLGDATAFEHERPFTVLTQQFDPSGTISPGMKILGSSARSRADAAPNFEVNTQGAPYYVVEFASDVSFFDSAHHVNDRTPNTFWASWSESPVLEASNGFYPMPLSVWNNLKPSDHIYFRVGTTTTTNTWENYRVSVGDDSADGPNITLEA